MNAVFEKRMATIESVREAHREISLRQRMAGLARGDFDDEEDALAGMYEPPPLTSDLVLESFARELDMSQRLRVSAPDASAFYEIVARAGLDLPELDLADQADGLADKYRGVWHDGDIAALELAAAVHRGES